MNNSSISKINPNSAGIDIGTEYIFIGIENKTVVSFPTFTHTYIKAIILERKQHYFSCYGSYRSLLVCSL